MEQKHNYDLSHLYYRHRHKIYTNEIIIGRSRLNIKEKEPTYEDIKKNEKSIINLIHTNKQDNKKD